MPPRYSESEARQAVADSMSYAEALRRLGMRPAGGNHLTLRKYVRLWGIAVDHFDPAEVRPHYMTAGHNARAARSAAAE